MRSSWPDGVTSYEDMRSYAKTLFGEQCAIEDLLREVPEFAKKHGRFLNRADRSPIIWTMRNYEMYPGKTAAIYGYRRFHQTQKERSSSPKWPRPDSHLASHSKSPYQGRQGPRATPLPETNNASSSERQQHAFVPKQSPQWNWTPASFLESLD